MPPAEEPGKSTKPARRGGSALVSKENRRTVAGLSIGALVAVFAVLNLDEVEVNWIVGTVSTPLIVVIGVTFLLGMVLGWIAHAARGRRRRRERRAEARDG